MENNKIIKITIAVIMVLVLSLVGYFLMTNGETNSEENDILLEMGTIRLVNGTLAVIETTPSEDMNLPEGQIELVIVSVNNDTQFTKMPINTWLNEPFTKSDEISTSLTSLKAGETAAIYKDREATVEEGKLFTATKIILLTY